MLGLDHIASMGNEVGMTLAQGLRILGVAAIVVIAVVVALTLIGRGLAEAERLRVAVNLAAAEEAIHGGSKKSALS